MMNNKLNNHRDIARPIDNRNFILEANSLEDITLQIEDENIFIKYKDSVIYGLPMLQFNQGTMYARQWNATPDSIKWAIGNLITRYRNTRVEERGLYDGMTMNNINGSSDTDEGLSGVHEG